MSAEAFASRRLVIVWAVLGVLIGAILFAQRADFIGTGVEPHDDAQRRAGSRDLVPVPLAQLGAVEIVLEGRTHRFERGARNAWFYHAPHDAAHGTHEHESDAAAAQRIERALSAFIRTRVERRLSSDFAGSAAAQPASNADGGADLRTYGLASPSMLILLFEPSRIDPLARYSVGDVAPDTVSRYVQRLGDPEVMTIANYQIENLRDLVAAVAPHTHGDLGAAGSHAVGPGRPAGTPAATARK